MMNQLQAAKKIFSAIGPVVSETIESLADDGRIDSKEALKIGLRLANGVNFAESGQRLAISLDELAALARDCGVYLVDGDDGK